MLSSLQYRCCSRLLRPCKPLCLGDMSPEYFQAEGGPHTGTTIVAVTYAEGVVIGADSRVSTGTYVSNRASDKLTPLHDFVWLLRSGSAADTQLVADYGATIYTTYRLPSPVETMLDVQTRQI